MLLDLYTYFCNAENIPNKIIGSNYLSAEYKCPLDTEDMKFWSEMHLITYIISGKKDWYADDELVEVKAGDAVFIKNGVYSTKQYFDVDHCIIAFMLNDDFIKKFLIEYSSLNLPKSSNDPQKSIVRIDVNESIKSIIYSVASYLNQGREIPQELVEIKFKELLFNIILNPKNEVLAQYFNEIQMSDKSSLEHVMNKNFHHDLSMEEYARLCGRSLSTFKRDFQDCFGTSPGKWLLEKRLDHAKGLLLNTNLNINEVCYDSGFKNTSHFNKAFKERFELPPLQFRQATVS